MDENNKKLKTPLSAEYWDTIIQKSIDQFDEDRKRYGTIKIIATIVTIVIALGISQIRSYLKYLWNVNLSIPNLNYILIIIVAGIMLIMALIQLRMLVLTPYKESEIRDRIKLSVLIGHEFYQAIGIIFFIMAGFTLLILSLETVSYHIYPTNHIGIFRLIIFLGISIWLALNGYGCYNVKKVIPELRENKSVNIDLPQSIYKKVLFACAIEFLVILALIGCLILGPPTSIPFLSAFLLAGVFSVPIFLLFYIVELRDKNRVGLIIDRELNDIQQKLRTGEINTDEVADRYYRLEEKIIAEMVDYNKN